MNFEEYWEQTRRAWQQRVISPRLGVWRCGFCDFGIAVRGPGDTCEYCPVIRVYGHFCGEVVSVQAFSVRYDADAVAEELRPLAEAVVQELDDKKAEFIAAMRELWEEANAGHQT